MGRLVQLPNGMLIDEDQNLLFDFERDNARRLNALPQLGPFDFLNAQLPEDILGDPKYKAKPFYDPLWDITPETARTLPEFDYLASLSPEIKQPPPRSIPPSRVPQRYPSPLRSDLTRWSLRNLK